MSVLTTRELEVLKLSAQGYRVENIAARLGISEQTVKNHRNSIVKRLAVTNIAHAVHKAHKLGFLADVE